MSEKPRVTVKFSEHDHMPGEACTVRCAGPDSRVTPPEEPRPVFYMLPVVVPCGRQAGTFTHWDY
jgi:hypothetical protein